MKKQGRRGRPRSHPHSPGSSMVSLPRDLTKTLDAVVDSESKRTGYRLTRTDILRKALPEGLERLQAKVK